MTDVTTEPAEIWRPVLGWEELYEVSDRGRVRSAPRGGTRGGLRTLKTEARGYKHVNLYRDGVCTWALVHSLVLEAFVCPRPPGQVARHGPNGISDNSPGNLSWGMQAENVGPDKWRDGTMQHGERNGRAKLTEADVRQIRARLAAGDVSRTALAAEYGVHQTCISSIANGKTWAGRDRRRRAAA